MAKTYSTRCRAYCLSLTQRPERFANAEAALKAKNQLLKLGFILDSVLKTPWDSWKNTQENPENPDLLHSFSQQQVFPY